MINIDGNKPIKSKIVRNIIIIITVILVVAFIIGVTTNKISEIPGIKFNTEKEDTLKVKNKTIDNTEGIYIEKMNGDVIKDSAVKNEYNYNKIPK